MHQNGLKSHFLLKTPDLIKNNRKRSKKGGVFLE